MHVFERVAEVNQHQVTFVADVGIDRGTALHCFNHSDGLPENAIEMERFLLPPSSAAEAKHLVKDIRAFERERGGRKLSHAASPIPRPAEWASRTDNGRERFRRTS